MKKSKKEQAKKVTFEVMTKKQLNTIKGGEEAGTVRLKNENLTSLHPN